MGKQETIEHIADALTVPIPHRPAKPAKARKTWRALEVGREIRNTLPTVIQLQSKIVDSFVENFELPPGFAFKVVMVDEEGAWLVVEGSDVKVRLEDTKWQEKFEKIPKRRSKRSS